VVDRRGRHRQAESAGGMVGLPPAPIGEGNGGGERE
jgi:hypothetical protein